MLELWERVVSAPPWSRPPVWVHGDLHPGNLLVDEGRLSAVIDFGDLAAGDPATDLSVIWMMLPPSTRSSFGASARGEFDPLDDDTLIARAGGHSRWVRVPGQFSGRRGDGCVGLATINAALNDE